MRGPSGQGAYRAGQEGRGRCVSGLEMDIETHLMNLIHTTPGCFPTSSERTPSPKRRTARPLLVVPSGKRTTGPGASRRAAEIVGYVVAASVGGREPVTPIIWKTESDV